MWEENQSLPKEADFRPPFSADVVLNEYAPEKDRLSYVPFVRNQSP